jgi:YVTN family beta-propeller protein
MKNLIWSSLLFLLFSSCIKEKIPDYIFPKAQNGVFVVNEGNYLWSNASLTYIDLEKDTVYNDIFAKKNNIPIGDVAQSMVIIDSLAYICVNNSGYIIVINPKTFDYITQIIGFQSPRFILSPKPDLAYVSDLYDKKISVFNTKSYQIVSYIHTGHTTEKMLLHNNKVFVSCWSYDNKILIINTDNETVEDSIQVGKQPNSMVFDKNDNLWVLCDGGFSGSAYGQENASLIKISTSDYEIIQTYLFPDINNSPIQLTTNDAKDTLFFINKDIYAMCITDSQLPNNPIIQSAQNQNFYSIALEATSGNLFISDVKDYMSSGDVYRYKSDGTFIRQYIAGINPGMFCFFPEQ